MRRFFAYKERRVAALAALTAVVFPQFAQAELQVSPLRQVITETSPRAVYEISNPSARTITAEISWVDLHALESGYEAASPHLRKRLSAAPYLVVSPTFFYLEPGARREVVVSLKDAASPPKNERRSHLLIETHASRTPLRKVGGMPLDINVGLSTPVILRDRHRQTDAEIQSARLTRNADGLLDLETLLTLDGRASAFGRLRVLLEESGGEVSELARIENVAVFTDAEHRKIVAPLNKRHLPRGVLSILFEGAAEYEGEVFHRRDFEVGPPA